MSESPLEVLKGIREVVESYFIFSQENSEQDPGFVLRQLSSVFDSANSTNFKEGNDEASILVAKIQRIYRVYKVLSKWADDAAQILIENLLKLLFPNFVQKKSEVNFSKLVVVAPASTNSVNGEESSSLFPVEHQTIIEFPVPSSDQGQNKGLPQDSEFQETENEQPSPSTSEDSSPSGDDDDDEEEEMESSGDENDVDQDYQPSFSDYSSGSGSRRRNRKRSQEGSFPCEFCGRLFGQTGHRSDHIKLKHTREGLFFCSVCGYGALSSHKLNLHEAGHNGMDCPIPCNYCDRRFKTQKSRLVHEKAFCLEKPFH